MKQLNNYRSHSGLVSQKLPHMSEIYLRMHRAKYEQSQALNVRFIFP